MVDEGDADSKASLCARKDAHAIQRLTIAYLTTDHRSRIGGPPSLKPSERRLSLTFFRDVRSCDGGFPPSLCDRRWLAAGWFLPDGRHGTADSVDPAGAPLLEKHAAISWSSWDLFDVPQCPSIRRKSHSVRQRRSGKGCCLGKISATRHRCRCSAKCRRESGHLAKNAVVRPAHRPQDGPCCLSRLSGTSLM